MASTYTVNLGIEKIGTGEQSGTWGNTTNTNFDLIDQAINGAVTVTLASAGTSGSPNTLAITDGAVSDGRNKFIEFADGADLGATAYVQLTPNDAEKLVHIRNSLSGGRSVIVFQGTYNASNDFEIPNGKDVVLKFDGAGASATVTDVFAHLQATAITTPSLTATTADINGGNIDGTVIGAATPAAGSFTTGQFGTSLNVDGTVTADGLEVEAAAPIIEIDSSTASSLATLQFTTGGTVDSKITHQASSGAMTIDSGRNATWNGTINFITDTVQNLQFSRSAAVFNDGSADIDFRVESDANTHMLFVDGGNNRVGIGSSSTSGMLTVGNDNATRAYSDRVRTEWNSIFGVTENTHYQRFKLTADVIRSSAYVKVTIQPRSGGGITDMNGATLEGSIWRADGGAQFALTLINNAAWGTGGVSLSEPVASGNDIIFGVVVGNNGTGSTYDVACKVELIGNTDYAFTYSEIAGTTAATGTNPGQGHFFYSSGSQLLGMDSGGTVVNEASADRDFRVESDTNTHALFLNGGNGHFGIGESSPGSLLHVSGSGSGGWLYLNNTNATADHVMYFRRQNSDVAYLGLLNTDQYWLNGSAASKVVLQPQAATELVINESSHDADFRVESDTNTHMLFVDAGNNRVGIGTSSPNATFSVAGSIRIEGTNPVPIFSEIGDANNCLKIDSNSDVVSGGYLVGFYNNGVAKAAIFGNGDIKNATNSYGSLSDQRLKENILDAESQWNDIKNVRVRKFSLISEGSSRANMLGVIAQELEAANMAGLVDEVNEPETGEVYKSVKYSILYMKAVKALQEAMARIETLEARIAALESN